MSLGDKQCPKPVASIRDDHKERMMFNWNKQPLYTMPPPCITYIEIAELEKSNGTNINK